MRILVVGGGGREHAIVRKLKESPRVTALYCAPGNGGIAADATCVPIRATEVERLAQWAAEEKMDYVVVAPDDPLCMGLVDELQKRGVPAFGPDRAAARIEGSKVFAKDLMKRYGIPTASYRAFDDAQAALAYVRGLKTPVAVKADGLALGKGVILCRTAAQAEEAVNDMMCKDRFGASGRRVVVEEWLEGPEVSVLCLTDGRTLVPLASAMDHKRALDGDQGLNTGGMGVIAPNPFYTEAIARQCMSEIFLPTVRAMQSEGCPFRGCLYFGLMLTAQGPKVIEYNCRFGDPEAQAVLPLLQGDLLEAMLAVTRGELDQVPLSVKPGASCCVIAASGGYPEHYETGKPIFGLEQAQQTAQVFHAGTRREGSALLTAGGRVLGVTATAPTLSQAVSQAYEAARHISFEGMHMRSDIGARALRALG